MGILGKWQTVCQFDSLALITEFLVADVPSQDILLGFDFLSKYGVVVDFGKKECRIMGKMLPLIVPADIDTPRTVIVLEDTVIPPRSEAIIAGKVDNSFVACCEEVTSQEGAESPRMAGVPPKETWLQTSDSTVGRESEVAVPGARSEGPPVTPTSEASGVPGSSAASVGSQGQRERLAPTTQDQGGQGSSHTGHMKQSMTSQVPMTGEVQQGAMLSKDLRLGRARRAPVWSRDYDMF
ncbi:uncharacterized protein LOC132156662 [Carassius carassius]|uniref:uncharacterized protein LOC132156662 n=1 Tax=Carassius carassius TaxID=217509 RepID=UPI002868E236|nr:uncharacterized protein LOC132156662 [Carassius carassius]